MELHELSRVIGGLEQAIRNTNAQHQVVMEKLDEIRDTLSPFKASTELRMTDLEEDVGALKRIKDRAIMVMAVAGIGAGGVGAGSATALTKIAKWITGA